MFTSTYILISIYKKDNTFPDFFDLKNISQQIIQSISIQVSMK